MKKDLGLGNAEFITIPGRTTKEIKVKGGTVAVRNCGPAHIYINVVFIKDVK